MKRPTTNNFSPLPLAHLSHAHGGVRSDAGKESEFCQEMQGLFLVFGQCGVERETRFAGKAGALIFLHVDLLRFDFGVREMYAFDEMLHVVNREREGAGELPFVGEIAEDITRHGERERLFVFDEARGRMKTQREAVRERVLAPRFGGELRDEFGMVAFEPAREGGVENASGVHGHGGVLGGGEGEDEAGEIHGHCTYCGKAT